MHAHIIETPRRETRPEDTEVSVTPVGTFAAGQAAEGSIPVVVGAEVGSFAAGQAEDRTDEAV